MVRESELLRKQLTRYPATASSDPTSPSSDELKDHRLFNFRTEGLGQWSLSYSQAVILEAQLYWLGYLGCERQAT